jgi:CRISPR-associated endonuclease Cas2
MESPKMRRAGNACDAPAPCEPPVTGGANSLNHYSDSEDSRQPVIGFLHITNRRSLMALYVITYDLIKRKDYPKLWEELERLKAFRTQESVWLANLGNERASEVKDHFAKFIDDDDKLMVIKFVGSPSFTKANKGTNDWIGSNV